MLILRNLLLSLIVPCLFFTDNAASADFYKWIDSEGIVHFSDRTPDNGPIKKTIDSTFSIKGDRNLGTGFFISHDGFAITCRHVIEDDDNHTAIFNDGKEYPIGIVSLNERYDLALIIVLAHEETPYLSIGDPYSMTPGERIFAVGNSLGLQSTVTEGIFTGLRVNIATNEDVLQFSAPIDPGNSGGPVVDEDGRAVGVISWEIVSRNGSPVSGVGFAVPSNYLLREYGYYLR